MTHLAPKNKWKIIGLTLIAANLLLAFYLFIYFPTQKQRQWQQDISDMKASYFWLDLSRKQPLYQAIFDQGLRLNPVNEQIYIKDVQALYQVFQANTHAPFSDILKQYAVYNFPGAESFDALCLQLQFIQRYGDKLQASTAQRLKTEHLTSQQETTSPTRMANAMSTTTQLSIAQQRQALEPWLNDRSAINEYYASQNMRPHCQPIQGAS